MQNIDSPDNELDAVIATIFMVEEKCIMQSFFLCRVDAGSPVGHTFCINFSERIIAIFSGEPGILKNLWNLAATSILGKGWYCRDKVQFSSPVQ